MSAFHLRRRAFAVASLGLAAGVAVPARAAAPRADKGRVTIAVGGKGAFYYLPLTLAEQLGFFRDEGLQVEVLDVSGGAPAVETLLGGTADVCSAAFEHVVRLQARNKLFQSFVLQGRAPQIAFGIAAHSLPGYRGIADLRGRRIGVSAPGSSTHTVARRVLANAGVPHGDFSVVGVGSGLAALAALRAGEIDAMANTDPLMTLLEQRGEIRVVSDTRTLRGTQEVFGGSMPAACLFATSDFIAKRPTTCQALANAIVHALKWLQTAGPSDLLKSVPETYLLGDRAVYLAAFNRVRESIALDGLVSDEGARTALRVLVELEPALKADKVDLARTYTNDFARKAKELFRA